MIAPLRPRLYRPLQVLLPLLLCSSALFGQSLDTLEVRFIHGAGDEIGLRLWSDTSGVLVLGSTTAQITANPVDGKQWFLTAFDDNLSDLWHLNGVFVQNASISDSTESSSPASIDICDITRGADVFDSDLPGASPVEPTAWILANHLASPPEDPDSGEPLIGGWRARLSRFSPQGQVESFDFDEHPELAGWTQAACLVHDTSSTLAADAPRIWAVGTHYDAPFGLATVWWAAADLEPSPTTIPPASPAFYDIGLASLEHFAPFSGLQGGLRAVDADLYGDTLYIAAALDGAQGASARAFVCLATRDTPGGSSLTADFTPHSMFVLDMDSVRPAALAAGPLGVALTLTRDRSDGTTDHVFALLKKGAADAPSDELGELWRVEPLNDENQVARAVVWAGESIVFASYSEIFGAGGSGARLEKRYFENGAWHAGHTFGGTADEDIFDLTRDHAGRILFTGWSRSNPDPESQDGSRDAWLVRAPSHNFATAYEENVGFTAVGYFLGLDNTSSFLAPSSARPLRPYPNPALRNQTVRLLQSSSTSELSLTSLDGRLQSKPFHAPFSFAQFPQLKAGAYILTSQGRSARLILRDQ
ncbi:MAG: hypothetical protein P8M07_00265 [Flavobacteriales bacterium]|nr:hypothetical protein [Flavobacteriales bacterium]